MSASSLQFDVFEDSGELLLARIDYAGTDATIANTSSIAYKSYNMTTGALVTSGSLTVASVMYATLQTGDEWTVDTEGYNFRWDAPGTLWPDGGVKYSIEVTFTPSSGSGRIVVWIANAKALYGS